MPARVKQRALLLLLCSALLLSGCRVRTTAGQLADPALSLQAAGGAADPAPGGGDGAPSPAAPQQETAKEGISESGGPSGGTRENPDAQRKEYDERAGAEIVEGTGRLIHTPGEGEGAFAIAKDAPGAVSKSNEEAEKTAIRTVAAQEAEEKGVSEAGETADSALTYYTVLLHQRAASLFECKRLNVYWEMPQDHVTVFKTSLEHRMILEAGAYDVSARLLEENLQVDDGWISRKNPEVIIKAVDREILGSGVLSAAGAEAAYAGLIGRPGWAAMDAVKNRRVLLIAREMLDAPYLQTAVTLLLAQTAYPDLYADVDAQEALRALMEEAAGHPPGGVYYYAGDGT